MEHFLELYRETLVARGRSDHTVKAYLGWLKRFGAFIDKPLDKVELEDVRAYQRYVAARRRICFSTFNQCCCALRVFYRDCLERDWDMRRLPFQKRGRTLPIILSLEEVERLIQATANLKHRAVLMTGYGCGLRISETLSLKPVHIDSSRMVVRVARGKGNKDRYVMLPAGLLATLRRYWRQYRPAVWLFEGQEAGRPLSVKTIQTIFHQSRRRAGIAKRVSFHSLRHSFATHLLEDGVNVRVIQALLGHRSLRSTQLYIHLAKTYLNDTTSPLDRLGQARNTAPKR